MFQGPPRFRQWWGHGFGEWVDIIRGDTVSKEVIAEKKIVLVAQLVKNLPAMQETWVRFLG